MGSKAKREKGEEDDIVDKNLRCLQALSYKITSVARDIAAATKAASPLEKGLVMYLWRDDVTLSEAEFCRLTGIARTGVKAEASTSASW